MFLFQKLKYDYKHIDSSNREDFVKEIDLFISDMVKAKPNFIAFDTETNGLNIINNKPFLIAIGYDNVVRSFDFDSTYVNAFFKMLSAAGVFKNEDCLGLVAHNCKFDYHMLENGGVELPKDIPLFDSITVARLTEYADLRESMSLEYLGSKYVDESAKFAGKVIKNIIKNINKAKRLKIREQIMEIFPDDGYFAISANGRRRGTAKLTQLLEEYDKRIMFVNADDPKFKFIEENFKEATYEDVYKKEPDLMRNYIADDIVILIEYLKRAVPTLKNTDKDYQVLKREGKMIRIAAEMEKVGIKVDIDYMLNARKEITKYRELLYFELNLMSGVEFSVGQHNLIKKLLLKNYGVKSEKCDEKALKYIRDNGEGEVVDFVNNILELRTIDKWLSTYIDGKLNQIINGRIHTDMNNNGAISGRISCDMQQQPRNPLYDGKKVLDIENSIKEGKLEEFSEDYYKAMQEAELFHPRQMFITDEGYSLFFIDMSQMELRVQAYYTILTASEPDLNLCRAYIPYKCYADNLGERLDFDFNDIDLLKDFKDYTWYKNENDEEWTPTDLHSQTTHHAFPEIEIGSKEFKRKRTLGKVSNFLKLYQGGVTALMETLDIDRETAEKLDRAFYTAFPMVQEYQEWVNRQAALYGFVENLYGRRYYIKSSKWYYKLCNYLIQGTCADMVKTFEINISEFLKEGNYKSKMVLPVHDEIIFLIAEGEEHLVHRLKAFMEDTYAIIKNIPMVAEIEFSKTNWREKVEYDG